MSGRPFIRPGGAAAAVALLLTLVGGAWLLLRAPRLLTGPPNIRPITAAQLKSDQPLILAWEGGGPPYDVTLVRADGEPVWRGERLPAALVRIPPQVPLRDGKYRWQVEGRDAAGRPFASPWFDLRIEAPTGPARPVSHGGRSSEARPKS